MSIANLLSLLILANQEDNRVLALLNLISQFSHFFRFSQLAEPFMSHIYYHIFFLFIL